MSLRKVKAIDLAEQIGINRGSMSLFLSGKTNLSQDKIEATLRYLNIELVIKE
ncbi:helix-turn-helix domain-containing protein [Parabacteroides sp. HGS0025]|uniref:helix-turn-helix domain-containing protein n=2 Tax=Parabacteroides TaxID=375288 RepID=UPI00350FD33D